MKAKELLDKINRESLYGVEGYLEQELIYFENLYDVEVKGEFREFLKGAGRSSGCNFKSLGYECHFDLWVSKNVRLNVLCNAGLKEDITALAFKEMKEQKQYDLKKHRFFKYIEGKPFHISTENQTQEMFILTAEKNPLVFQLDTNEENIIPIKRTFIEYVYDLIDWGISGVEESRKWAGEFVIPKYT